MVCNIKMLNSQEAFKDLKEIKGVFDFYGVPFFVAYGTCLGFVRDNDFISGDDDMDIVVTAKIDYKTRKAIGWKLIDVGFAPQPISFKIFDRMEPSEIGYNGDEKSGIIVCRKRVDTSIFFFGEEDCPDHGKEMVCVPKYMSGKLICSPSRFYEKGEWFKFRGEKFLLPSPVKEYLEFTYGDWKTPSSAHAKQYNPYHAK